MFLSIEAIQNDKIAIEDLIEAIITGWALWWVCVLVLIIVKIENSSWYKGNKTLWEKK